MGHRKCGIVLIQSSTNINIKSESRISIHSINSIWQTFFQCVVVALSI
jgi:hypothetical protein